MFYQIRLIGKYRTVLGSKYNAVWEVVVEGEHIIDALNKLDHTKFVIGEKEGTEVEVESVAEVEEWDPDELKMYSMRTNPNFPIQAKFISKMEE